MSSILLGYEYDTFISYPQNDNRSGRVTEFVKQLLEELLGGSPDTSGQAASGGKEKNRE